MPVTVYELPKVSRYTHDVSLHECLMQMSQAQSISHLPKQTEVFKDTTLQYQGRKYRICTARLNDGRRLFYTTAVTCGKQEVLLALEVMDDHRHDRAPILVNSMHQNNVSAQLNELLGQIEADELAAVAENVPAAAAAAGSTMVSGVRKKVLRSPAGRLCVMSAKQDEVARLRLDGQGTLLLAAGGTGKTLCALQNMRQQVAGRIGYFALSPVLCQQIAESDLPGMVDVSTLTWSGFLQRVNITQPEKVPADLKYLGQWLSQLSLPRRIRRAKSMPFPAFDLKKVNLQKLYAEFTQVLIQPVSGLASAYLSRDAYLGLGGDQSFFSNEEQRAAVYDLFERYIAELAASKTHYEPHLFMYAVFQQLMARSASQMTAGSESLLDGLVIDEVQQLHVWQLYCLFQVLAQPKQGNFYLCGDPHQTFRAQRRLLIDPIRKTAEYFGARFVVNHLSNNFRSGKRVNALCNTLLSTEQAWWGSTERGTDWELTDSLNVDGNVICSSYQNSAVKKSNANTVILVPDELIDTPEKKAEVQEQWGRNIVPLSQAGGREWLNVVLYSFSAQYPQEMKELSACFINRGLSTGVKYGRKRDEQLKPSASARDIYHAIYLAASRSQQAFSIVEPDGVAIPKIITGLVDAVTPSVEIAPEDKYAAGAALPAEAAQPASARSTPLEWLVACEEYVRTQESALCQTACDIMWGDEVWGTKANALLIKQVFQCDTLTRTHFSVFRDVLSSPDYQSRFLKAASDSEKKQFLQSFDRAAVQKVSNTVSEKSVVDSGVSQAAALVEHQEERAAAPQAATVISSQKDKPEVVQAAAASEGQGGEPHKNMMPVTVPQAETVNDKVVSFLSGVLDQCKKSAVKPMNAAQKRLHSSHVAVFDRNVAKIFLDSKTGKYSLDRAYRFWFKSALPNGLNFFENIVESEACLSVFLCASRVEYAVILVMLLARYEHENAVEDVDGEIFIRPYGQAFLEVFAERFLEKNETKVGDYFSKAILDSISDEYKAHMRYFLKMSAESLDPVFYSLVNSNTPGKGVIGAHLFLLGLLENCAGFGWIDAGLLYDHPVSMLFLSLLSTPYGCEILRQIGLANSGLMAIPKKYLLCEVRSCKDYWSSVFRTESVLKRMSYMMHNMPDDVYVVREFLHATIMNDVFMLGDRNLQRQVTDFPNVTDIGRMLAGYLIVTHAKSLQWMLNFPRVMVQLVMLLASNVNKYMFSDARPDTGRDAFSACTQSVLKDRYGLCGGIKDEAWVSVVLSQHKRELLDSSIVVSNESVEHGDDFLKESYNQLEKALGFIAAREFELAAREIISVFSKEDMFLAFLLFNMPMYGHDNFVQGLLWVRRQSFESNLKALFLEIYKLDENVSYQFFFRLMSPMEQIIKGASLLGDVSPVGVSENQVKLALAMLDAIPEMLDNPSIMMSVVDSHSIYESITDKLLTNAFLKRCWEKDVACRHQIPANPSLAHIVLMIICESGPGLFVDQKLKSLYMSVLQDFGGARLVLKNDGDVQSHSQKERECYVTSIADGVSVVRAVILEGVRSALDADQDKLLQMALTQ